MLVLGLVSGVGVGGDGRRGGIEGEPPCVWLHSSCWYQGGDFNSVQQRSGAPTPYPCFNLLVNSREAREMFFTMYGPMCLIEDTWLEVGVGGIRNFVIGLSYIATGPCRNGNSPIQRESTFGPEHQLDCRAPPRWRHVL